MRGDCRCGAYHEALRIAGKYICGEENLRAHRRWAEERSCGGDGCGQDAPIGPRKGGEVRERRRGRLLTSSRLHRDWAHESLRKHQRRMGIHMGKLAGAWVPMATRQLDRYRQARYVRRDVSSRWACRCAGR